MDIERTMAFVLENLAAVTAAQQRAEVRAARMERQIGGLQKLMVIGMRRLMRLEQRTEARFAELTQAHKELATAQRELAVQQKRTDQKFERWLDSMKGGASNGRKRRP
jgi:peptidoglycan hydrolase CwlO-like protein